MSGGGNVSETLISSGVAGLDDVLSGGLRRNRSYLFEGVPGSGKTTLALQFLLGRREPRRAGSLRHAIGDRRRAPRRRRSRTAGTWTA